VLLLLTTTTLYPESGLDHAKGEDLKRFDVVVKGRDSPEGKKEVLF